VVEGISRRNMLKAGGALGVLGALSGFTPAWAWSTNRSVVGGDLATVPPEDVWDPEADAVVHRLFREEGIERIEDLNELLRPWHRNDQALPDGLPADLVTFIEQAREAPAWLDQRKLVDAYDFYETRGMYTGILYGLGSGMMSCAIPDEARAVYHSKGGADMKDRVSKTAKLGYDIGVQDAFGPSGEMIVTCIKTRLAHSGVRYLITSSPRWQAGGDIPAPISQRDLMITWHSLATFIYRSLGSWNVRLTQPHSDGFLHVWQATAHYLGIEHVYIPATWSDAQYQSDLTLDPVLGTTPEGIALADMLLDLATDIDGGLSRPVLESMTRYLAGNNKAGQSVADMLGLEKRPALDASIRNGWPMFIAARELGTNVPLSDQLFWTFDEVLRLGLLWFLADGPGPITIEIPIANRPESSYPVGAYPAS
jgi:endo-cleaving rubber dioxygenase